MSLRLLSRWLPVPAMARPRRPLSISASHASCSIRFSLRMMISGASRSSRRLRRLLRLMTRRYRSFRSEVAKRPPSSCTIGRRSGGMTGRVDRIIHSGRAPDLRKASIRRRRLIAFLRRWPEVWRISTCSCWARSSRSSCSMIFLIASAPMPASNIRPCCSDRVRYSDSVRVCMTLMSASCCSRGARRQLGVIGLAGDLLALVGECLVDARRSGRRRTGRSRSLASALACLTSVSTASTSALTALRRAVSAGLRRLAGSGR